MYMKIMDRIDILRKSDVDQSSRQDETQLECVSKSRNCALLSLFYYLRVFTVL